MAGGLIGLIGGNPLMKVKKVIGEYLPLTKSLDGGAGLSGLMGSVINGGGLQSIISNPMGAITGQLQGVLGNASSALTSGLGGQASGLVSALTGSGGLQGALGALTGAGDGLLSGGGIMNLVSHANIADMAGSVLPSNLSLDTVLGPLNAQPLVEDIARWVPGMVSNVLTGALPIADAIAQTEAHTATVTAVVAASADAMSAVAAMAPDISAVSTVAATFVSAPPEIQGVLERAMSPETVSVMRASVATHLDEPES